MEVEVYSEIHHWWNKFANSQEYIAIYKIQQFEGTSIKQTHIYASMHTCSNMDFVFKTLLKEKLISIEKHYWYTLKINA
jgi:hypothetical protein